MAGVHAHTGKHAHAQVTKLCDLSPHDVVCSVGWSQKGTYLSVGCNSGRVQIWDAARLKVVRTLEGHRCVCARACVCMLVSAVQRHLCIQIRTWKICDMARQKVDARWRAVGEGVTCMCVYVCMHTCMHTRMEDLEQNMAQHESQVRISYAVHASASTNTQKRSLWHGAHMCPIHTHTHTHTHRARVSAVAWGTHVLSSGSRDRSIQQRDVRMPEPLIAKLQGHRSEVCGLKVRPVYVPYANAHARGRGAFVSACGLKVGCVCMQMRMHAVEMHLCLRAG